YVPLPRCPRRARSRGQAAEAFGSAAGKSGARGGPATCDHGGADSGCGRTRAVTVPAVDAIRRRKSSVPRLRGERGGVRTRPRTAGDHRLAVPRRRCRPGTVDDGARGVGRAGRGPDRPAGVVPGGEVGPAHSTVLRVRPTGDPADHVAALRGEGRPGAGWWGVDRRPRRPPRGIGVPVRTPP